MQNRLSVDQKKLFGSLLIIVILIILAIVIIVHFAQPSRSVVAYCKVYSQERIRLHELPAPQGQYPSATFDVTVNDAGQIAISLGKLDQVAPNEVESNVRTLQKLYQEVHDNPAMDVSASLSGESIDNSLKAWTQQYCSA